jgi:BASS family bile acid:Na+ symporter
MSAAGIVPDWLFSLVAATAIFAVMFDLGLAIVVAELRGVASRRGLMLRGLFAVLIAVPALAWLIARIADLPRAAEVGILLMAISPGAPIALRRSLAAGGHRSYAPALQIAVTLVAALTMPLWIALFSEFYAGHASAAPEHVAEQVFLAQLLPLGLGMATRRLFPEWSARFASGLHRAASAMMVLLLILALVDAWDVVVGAGLRVTLTIVAITVLALAVGHHLGGPEPATRTATAISSAARNPALALLVATLNNASPAVSATILAYLLIGAATVLPYALWRQRMRDAGAPDRTK